MFLCRLILRGTHSVPKPERAILRYLLLRQPQLCVVWIAGVLAVLYWLLG